MRCYWLLRCTHVASMPSNHQMRLRAGKAFHSAHTKGCTRSAGREYNKPPSSNELELQLSELRKECADKIFTPVCSIDTIPDAGSQETE